MSFFKSAKSHLEQLEKDCQEIAHKASDARTACDQSLKGKYENMQPEARAALLKQAQAACRSVRATLDAARQHLQAMEQDQCPGEELLAAQSKVLAATLDVDRASKALEESRQSLLSAMTEIEEFYGARSKEARHVRKILDELQ